MFPGKMKVVFLDVDGVLNTLESLGGGEEGENIIIDNKSGSSLELRCLQNLTNILLKTGAKIVVTSTWRLFPDMLEFLTRTVNDMYRHSLAWNNSEKGETEINEKSVIIGSTIDGGPPPFGRGRGMEVRVWLESHPDCDRFVVLDDDHKQSFQDNLFGDKQLPSGVKGMLVETKLGGLLDDLPFSDQGLTEKHVETVIDFLNKDT